MMEPSEGAQVYLSCMTINVGIKTGRDGKEIREREPNQSAKRREIFIKKIKEENPDIICFQEQFKMDLKHIDKALLDDLEKAIKSNYKTFYQKQESQKQAAVMVKNDVLDDYHVERIDFTAMLISRNFPKSKRAWS